MTKEIDKVLEVLFDIKGDKFYFKSYGRDLIQGLLYAERERCAKIAENYNNWHSGFYKIIADIAKNIRREK